MPKYLGPNFIAYDQRSGLKVKLKDIVNDGENRGVRTHFMNADPEHPQKFVRTPGPDRASMVNPKPERTTGTLTMRPSRVTNTTTMTNMMWPSIHIQTGEPGVNVT